MDTSETYIKMCDCPEIQGKSDLSPFHMQEAKRDLWYDFGNVWYSEYNGVKGMGGAIHRVWLPRQDQLQEMVPNKHMEPDWEPARWPLHLAQVVDEYASATYDYWQEICWQPESMEQLWLAFVMKEKHDKIWNRDVFE